MAKGKNRLEPYEKMLSKLIALTGGLIVLSAAVSGFDIKGYVEDLLAGGEEAPGQQEILEQVPEAGSSLYAEVNGGEPFFTRAEIAGAREVEQPYESYSDLDKLGRCGSAEALLDKSLMPTEERGSIGMIRPSGWHTYRYDDIIEDRYLYNRCHLIGYQLTGQNANEKNLITGSRRMNVDGMEPFESRVARYIRRTGGRVLYRVTPVFDGDDLVARGVLMEALSVEDGGEGICLNVFIYNTQPGVVIDYATGESWRE